MPLTGCSMLASRGCQARRLPQRRRSGSTLPSSRCIPSALFRLFPPVRPRQLHLTPVLCGTGAFSSVAGHAVCHVVSMDTPHTLTHRPMPGEPHLDADTDSLYRQLRHQLHAAYTAATWDSQHIDRIASELTALERTLAAMPRCRPPTEASRCAGLDG